MSVLFNHTGLINSLQNLTKSLAYVQGDIHNARFILSVGNGLVIVDPESGNYTYENVQTVVVTANLLPSKPPAESINIGTPFSRMYLKGKLVNPLTFSGELTNFITCEMLNNGNWVKGKFYPELNLSSGTVESFNISDALGTTISGYFEIDGDNAF